MLKRYRAKGRHRAQRAERVVSLGQLVLGTLAVAFVASYVLVCVVVSRPAQVSDCRLGPQDCGYADNWTNGDH